MSWTHINTVSFENNLCCLEFMKPGYVAKRDNLKISTILIVSHYAGSILKVHEAKVDTVRQTLTCLIL
jgi:hypothetical protein